MTTTGGTPPTSSSGAGAGMPPTESLPRVTSGSGPARTGSSGTTPSSARPAPVRPAPGTRPAPPTAPNPTVPAPGAAASAAPPASKGKAGSAGAMLAGLRDRVTGTPTDRAPLGTGRPAPAPRGPSAPPGATPRPAQPAAKARRVRLAVARVDPWSAMKMSFLLSFAAMVCLVVMTAVLWMILSGMNVFSDIDNLVQSLQPTTATDKFTIMDFVAFPRVMSLAMVLGVVNVILLTALGTLLAYLYNLSAALVGGVQLTLTDD